MSALVTGATGFVGSALVDRLLERGQAVRALIRDKAKAAGLRQRGVETLVGDVRDAQLVNEAAEGADVIYHCAAAGSWCSEKEILDTNVTATRNVLDAAIAQQPRRVIVMSSINVLGSHSYTHGNEEMPTRRTGDAHADVKIDGEELVASYVREHGVSATILRPGLIYGPGQNHLLKIAKAVRKGKFAFIGGRDNVVPLVYRSDMIDCLLLAAESDAADGQTYNITDGTQATIEDLAGTMANLLGVELKAKQLPYWLPRTVCTLFGLIGMTGPISRTTLRFLGTSRSIDIAKARQDLGFDPQIDIRTGLEKSIDWIKNQSETMAT